MELSSPEVVSLALPVAAIQGEGESGETGVALFVNDLPWLTSVVLSLFFVLVAAVAVVRRITRRSDTV